VFSVAERNTKKRGEMKIDDRQAILKTGKRA
jgi:hypothetical protein